MANQPENNPQVSWSSLRRLRDHAHKTHKLLAEGSSRAVFDYKDGKVVKVAMDSAGLSQNAVEVKLWNLAKFHGCEQLFTQVYDHDTLNRWVIHSKANTYRSQSGLNLALMGLYGYDHMEIHKLIGLSKQVRNKESVDIIDHSGQASKLVKSILKELRSVFVEKDEPLYSLLSFFTFESKIVAGDLGRLDSWGKDVNTGLPVIRDYGMDELTWNTYYDYE